MVAKYKVIENPTEEEIISCLSGEFFTKEMLKEKKLYPFYYYTTFKVQQNDGTRKVLKDCYSGQVDPMNGSYYGGYIVFEGEDLPIKFACRIPELPGILNYYEQRYGFKERFEPAEHYFKSVVHYTTIRTALSCNNAFKANGFRGVKFTVESYLDFCDISGFDRGGTFHEFNFDFYNYTKKGIKLINYEKKLNRLVTWKDQAFALSEMLAENQIVPLENISGVKLAIEAFVKIKSRSELKQTPLF